MTLVEWDVVERLCECGTSFDCTWSNEKEPPGSGVRVRSHERMRDRLESRATDDLAGLRFARPRRSVDRCVSRDARRASVPIAPRRYPSASKHSCRVVVRCIEGACRGSVSRTACAARSRRVRHVTLHRSARPIERVSAPLGPCDQDLKSCGCYPRRMGQDSNLLPMDPKSIALPVELPDSLPPSSSESVARNTHDRTVDHTWSARRRSDGSESCLRTALKRRRWESNPPAVALQATARPLSIDVKRIINPVVAGEVSDHEPRTKN